MISLVMKRKLVISLSLLLTVDWTYAKSAAGKSKKSTVDSEFYEDESGNMKVFLSVSSLALTSDGVIIERQLEMNWYGGKVRDGDIVALYNVDPQSSRVPPLEAIRVSNTDEGYYRTRIMYPRLRFSADNLSNECLGYWIVYVSQNKTVDISCLRARPFWINENQKYIVNFTLREVMLPGAHDSGSYSYFDPKNDNVFVRYTYAQEERIFDQLAYGIRYFDVRTSYYENIRPFYWINHNFIRTNNTLLEVLTDVVNFVTKTKELVILDFHHFPMGIHSMDDHEKLIKYISNILEDHMIPFKNVTDDVTIGDILKGDKRILAAYNHPHAYNDHGFWPPLCQVWGNERSLADLNNFFATFFSKHGSPSYLWSSMAELTPNFVYIPLHYKSGLRKMASDVNRFVTMWFRDLWWKSANVVATDYVLGNNMVNVAIETNRKRSIYGISAGQKIVKDLSSFCSS